MIYAIIVMKEKTKMLCTTNEVLALCQLSNIKDARVAFESIREDLPAISKDKYEIRKVYDLTNSEDFNDVVTHYMNYTINILIKKTDFNTYYINKADFKLNVSDIRFHDIKTNYIHVISKAKIVSDSQYPEKIENANSHIDDLICTKNRESSILEMSTFQRSGEVRDQYWKCVLSAADICVVFHDVHLQIILEMIETINKVCYDYNKWAYFFFATDDGKLFKINADDKLVIDRVI